MNMLRTMAFLCAISFCVGIGPTSDLIAQNNACFGCYYGNVFEAYGYPGYCDSQAANCNYRIYTQYCDGGHQLISTGKFCSFETPNGFGGCLELDAACQ